jgi:subtilisin-like proprotein convertase family protein
MRGTNRGWLVAALAGALTIAFAALAGGAIKTKTYSSGDIDKVISDLTPANHGFLIKTKRAKVKDINVALRVSHTSTGDLEVSLTNPKGEKVILANVITLGFFDQDLGSGSEDCNGTFTVFNDEAETPIEEGTTPYNGQFKPENPLSALDGSKLKGLWRLGVEDHVSGDDGILHCAELEVKYKKKKKHHHH